MFEDGTTLEISLSSSDICCDRALCTKSAILSECFFKALLMSVSDFLSLPSAVGLSNGLISISSSSDG